MECPKPCTQDASSQPSEMVVECPKPCTQDAASQPSQIVLECPKPCTQDVGSQPSQMVVECSKPCTQEAAIQPSKIGFDCPQVSVQDASSQPSESIMNCPKAPIESADEQELHTLTEETQKMPDCVDTQPGDYVNPGTNCEDTKVNILPGLIHKMSYPQSLNPFSAESKDSVSANSGRVKSQIQKPKNEEI